MTEAPAINAHLAPQLTDFVAMKNPGFALMVSAPWGAGKTHAVDRWRKDRDTLYVSLYGASSREDIGRAILLARIGLIDNGTARGVATVLSAGIEGAAAYFKVKNTLKLTDLAQAALPKILIFDDLERAEMPVTQLLAELNRFVEHDERNVILIANQAELEKRDPAYVETREKVIGRIIAIQPDLPAALEACLQAITDPAQTFLSQERDTITAVFAQSGCQNLRLLRQSLLEFTRFHKQLPKDITENTSGMRHLVATFLALSLAYHGGEISREELDQDPSRARMAWHRGGKIGPEPTDSPIKRLQERYRFQTPARLMGTVISGTLADRLLGDGHADAGFILTELQKSEVFNPAHFEAWQTLWSWRRRSEAEFTAALQTVEADLDKHAITDPLIILHLAGIFLNLANAKAIADPAEAIQPRFSAYIADLEMQGLLPNDWPKLDWMNPLLEESAFGLGFFCRETDAFQFLRTELRAALDRAYWRDNPNRALMLLGLCTTAPEDFCAALDGGSALAGLPDYRNIPVLTDLEPILFAETVFSRVYGIYDHPLSPFQTRIPRLEASSTAPQSGHPSEREWLHKVRDAAEQLAASASPLRAAQIHSALKGYLGFLDAAPDL